jgi:hypothetical protein
LIENGLLLQSSVFESVHESQILFGAVTDRPFRAGFQIKRK